MYSEGLTLKAVIEPVVKVVAAIVKEPVSCVVPSLLKVVIVIPPRLVDGPGLRILSRLKLNEVLAAIVAPGKLEI